MNFRTRFFLATLISLLLLSIIPLTRTPAPAPCGVITPAAWVSSWVDAQDDLILDYRGDLNAWIGTDLQGETHLLGYAVAEDADITTCA